MTDLPVPSDPAPSCPAGEAGLARDGFAVLPGLLQPAEVARLRPLVDRLVAAPPALTCVRPHNTLVPPAQFAIRVA